MAQRLAFSSFAMVRVMGKRPRDMSFTVKLRGFRCRRVAPSAISYLYEVRRAASLSYGCSAAARPSSSVSMPSGVAAECLLLYLPVGATTRLRPDFPSSLQPEAVSSRAVEMSELHGVRDRSMRFSPSRAQKALCTGQVVGVWETRPPAHRRHGDQLALLLNICPHPPSSLHALPEPYSHSTWSHA